MGLYFSERDGKWYVRINTTDYYLPAILEGRICRAIEEEVRKFNEQYSK